MGLDQIERDALARRERKHQKRLAIKAERLARTPQEYDRSFYEYKLRRKRAVEIRNGIQNRGRTIAWAAQFHGLTPDEVMNELKWLGAKQRKNRLAKHNRKRNRAVRARLQQLMSGQITVEAARDQGKAAIE